MNKKLFLLSFFLCIGRGARLSSTSLGSVQQDGRPLSSEDEGRAEIPQVMNTRSPIGIVLRNMMFNPRKDEPGRIEQLIEEVKEIQREGPLDIMAFQEVVNGWVQKAWRQRFNDFHIEVAGISFNDIRYPFVSYLPFACGLSMSLACLLFQQYKGMVGSTFLAFSFYPSIFLRLLSFYLPGVRHMLNRKTCQMGLLTALNKERFSDIRRVACKPFDVSGYRVPPLRFSRQFISSFVECSTYFLLKIVGRPGYLLLRCKDRAREEPLFILNAHLVPGIAHEERVQQVKELYNMIKEEVGRHRLLLCMDANTDAESRCIQYLLQQGFKDCWAEARPYDCGHTWVYENEKTRAQPMREPDGRIDYIWMKGFDEKESSVERIELFGQQPPASDHYGIRAVVSFK